MFTKNEGILDRLLRVVAAEIFFMLAWFWFGGAVQITFYVLSLVMLVTAATGFCGLYKIFGFSTNKGGAKNSKIAIGLVAALFIVIAVAGSYYSNFFTRKLFLEDYNAMNNEYKQTLFNTGQDKRPESITYYDSLVQEYGKFANKYTNYHPRVIAGDKNFNADLVKIANLISNLKEQVYTGDLQAAHTKFEEARPIFQDILKRNNFSMLAVYLVDFHDSMEKVIAEADLKNAAGVIESYSDANQKLLAVEEVANDDEIKAIRNNLETLLGLAKNGQVEELAAKATELKSSFVKVYLKRG